MVGWYNEQPQHHREVWARIKNEQWSARTYPVYRRVTQTGKATYVNRNEISFHNSLRNLATATHIISRHVHDIYHYFVEVKLPLDERIMPGVDKLLTRLNDIRRKIPELKNWQKRAHHDQIRTLGEYFDDMHDHNEDTRDCLQYHARDGDYRDQSEVLQCALAESWESIQTKLEGLQKEHVTGLVSHNERCLKDINECNDRTMIAIKQVEGLDKGMLCHPDAKGNC